MIRQSLSVRAMSMWMRLRMMAPSVAAAILLAGCSMHPLPEDVTRKNTYDIVEKIRCEAAEGLRGVPRDHPILKTTVIGYDFDFNIEEKNNAAGGNVTLTKEYSRGDLEVDGGASAERQRSNVRVFRILETLLQLTNADCGAVSKRANRAYPIAGAIGMQELVRTYVGLERLTNFGKTPGVTGGTQLPVAKDKEIPIVFSDVLTYTTHVGAGVKPELTLVALVGELKITNATINLNASRKDIHKVTVALARDPVKPVDPPAGGRAARVNSADEEYLRRFSNSTIYNARIGRVVETIAKKNLTAETLVLLELERRREQSEAEELATRLTDLLNPTP
jgi:hypothetical protein